MIEDPFEEQMVVSSDQQIRYLNKNKNVEDLGDLARIKHHRYL